MNYINNSNSNINNNSNSNINNNINGNNNILQHDKLYHFL